jgi:hypothetical protein
MTYKLYNDGPGFLLMDPTQPVNSIAVPDLEHLMQLRIRIGEYLDNATTDGPAVGTVAGKELTYINTVQARQVAQRQGITIPNRTIVYNCDAGNILGAKKDGGRWIVPKWSFVEWLKGYKIHRAKLDQQGQGPNATGDHTATTGDHIAT